MRRSNSSGTGQFIAFAAAAIVAGGLIGYFVIGNLHPNHTINSTPPAVNVSMPNLPTLAPKHPTRMIVVTKSNSDYTAPGAPDIQIKEDKSLSLAPPATSTASTTGTGNPPSGSMTNPSTDSEASQEAAGAGSSTSGAQTADNTDNPSQVSITPSGGADSGAQGAANSATGGDAAQGAATPGNPTTSDNNSGQSQPGIIPPSVPSGPIKFRVQAGTFLNPKDAHMYANVLQQHGVSSSVSMDSQGKKKLFHVQVGAYTNRADAEAAAKSFQQQGVVVSVAPVGH